MKRRWSASGLLQVFGLVALAACAQNGAVGADPPALRGGAWSWDAAPADDPRTPGPDVDRARLAFTATGVSAVLGCNTASGSYTQGPDGALTITLDGKTKMGCFDPVYEDRFYGLVQQTARYQVTVGRLQLFDGADRLLATLTRCPAEGAALDACLSGGGR